MSRRYTLEPPSLVIPKGLQIPYEKELNPDQLKVVLEAEGPSLVLAGPGSGKTRTLTYRVARLIEQGIPPPQILLMTFTVKAAHEMLLRVERLLKTKPEGLWGGTFHHIGNLILRRHAEKLKRTPAFGILDEEDAKDLIAACLEDLKTSPTRTRLPQAGVLEAAFSLSANTGKPLDEIVLRQYPQFAELIPWIEKAAQRYRSRKEKGNLMDYDDLLTGWRALLQDNPALKERYAEQFRYLLVDEYQDTNHLQFEIIQLMAGTRQNLCVVGDDAQSIYGFRGADLNNLLSFPKIFPKTTLYRLQTNYRSTPEILRLANATIAMNQRQFPKELTALKASGPLPAVVPATDARQQAVFVAQRILELREEGVALNEMAVLFRARFQSAEMELELAKRNIPYVVRGGVRFFEQAHLKDVLAHLKILVNPNDEISWERLLKLQEGIGSAYARRIWEKISQGAQPLQAALKNGAGEELPVRARTGWKRFQALLAELSSRSRKGQPPAELILTVLKGGYEEHLKTHFENFRDRKEDVEQLINLAAGYRESDRLLSDLTLREPFRGETIRGWEKPDELLALSTIHQAKGLEWAAVFLIGLVEGQFPHPKSLNEPEELEEERRLFYVAITRTKRELYLTYPLTRYTYQRGEVLMRPSTFIQELPDDLLELWRLGAQQPADELD
ncbi:MAG: ATP-dependent helicase [Candidatus Omnitrophica bacterium]|nr:ATP-dependent helicase [Candidatus Omnitrophota bacterium]